MPSLGAVHVVLVQPVLGREGPPFEMRAAFVWSTEVQVQLVSAWDRMIVNSLPTRARPRDSHTMWAEYDLVVNRQSPFSEPYVQWVQSNARSGVQPPVRWHEFVTPEFRKHIMWQMFAVAETLPTAFQGARDHMERNELTDCIGKWCEVLMRLNYLAQGAGLPDRLYFRDGRNGLDVLQIRGEPEGGGDYTWLGSHMPEEPMESESDQSSASSL